MKYNQPYGVSDPNAGYINGNPSTGTMGSIPPAASIENPQREIVNLIADAGLTPTDADLHQLARSVQSSHLMYAVDNGTANALAFNVMPPLLAYAAGQRWTVKVAATNTGPSVANINSLGARHIVYPLGGEMKGGELQAGGIVTLVDDGTNLQLTNVAAVTGSILTAPKTYYVNSITGSDTAYDGTAAVVSGLHGPFATVQRALTAAYTWNQNGYAIAIMLADGVYSPFNTAQPPNGAGSIQIIGNTVTPENVVIHAAVGEAILLQANGYVLAGLTVQSDLAGASPHNGSGIRLISCSTTVQNINFGACATAHIFIGGNATFVFTGLEDALPNDFCKITGDSPVHLFCAQNSLIYLSGTKLITVGNRNISIWAQCHSNAVIASSYQSQALGGSVTGQKFNVMLNGVINTGGGINYFPGNAAGVTSSGGQVF
jgi:hypothetical protein